MSNYVIKRDDGAYVADMRKSVNGSSYTRDIRKAQKFEKREHAEAHLCPGNEYVADIRSELE